MTATKNFLNTAFNYPMQTSGVFARDHLVKTHLKLVATIAIKKYRNAPNFDDILQEGNLALITAANNFKPECGFAFTTYAIQHVTSSMKVAYLNSRTSLRLFTTKPLLKAYRNINKYRTGHDIMSDDVAQKMATDLNISVHDVRGCEARLAHIETSTADHSDNNDPFEIPDYSQEPTSVLENLETEYKYKYKIPAALQKLSPREADIINQRWLIDEPVSRKPLAERYGISNERIAQIERAALTKMRKHLVD